MLKIGSQKQTKNIEEVGNVPVSNPEIKEVWREVENPYSINPKNIQDSEIKKAIKISHGIPGFAARYLGIPRRKLLKMINKNAKLKRYMHDEKENIIDIAEGRLFEALAIGKSWAIQYVLNTIGKERGWTTEPKKDDNIGMLFEALQHAKAKMDTEELSEYDKEQEQFNYEK